MPFNSALIGILKPDGTRADAPQPDGTYQSVLLQLGPGLMAGTPIQNGSTVTIPIAAAGGAARLVLAAGVFPSRGSGGSPAGSCIVQPSTDFPGTSTATFYGVVCTTTGTASAPAWAATTGYSSATSPPDIVSHNGVLYVCTATGASGSSGPSGLGAGIVDGSCVWRAARANLLLIDATASNTVLATLTTTYPLTAGAALPSAVELTADVTSALIPLASRHMLLVVIGGDTIDTSNFTGGACLGASLLFA